MSESNLADGFPHGTRINELSVPERLRMRYSIPGLDFVNGLFGGQGLTPSTVTYITGWPGAGKSTLMLQMARALNRRDDCFVLFNGREESLFQTKMVCERLFGIHQPDFYVGDDSLVRDHPGVNGIARRLIKAGKMGTILGHMGKLMREHPGKQPILLVDSLQAIDDGKYNHGTTNGQSPFRALRLINYWAKKTFAIVVLVGQVRKDGEAAGDNRLLHMIDAHLHLMIDTAARSETQGMRIMETRKNRYGHAGQAYVLNMGEYGLYEEGAYVVS